MRHLLGAVILVVLVSVGIYYAVLVPLLAAHFLTVPLGVVLLVAAAVLAWGLFRKKPRVQTNDES
ncbi:hypothetical protein [uncultured Microbacterium sp.]|uniref:hypothetical protein n=1 Tax=uncultured Microbacterium sp. TaxID=191216 RepID=UPI00262A9D27|nr:hypothetical protein [uncultured Microbacterium sp.]